jgi:glycosyltransferase involved in cell wall biosynthesis
VAVSSDRRRGAEVFGEALATGLGIRGWETRLLALAGSERPPRVDAELVSAVAPEDLGRLDLGVVAGLRRRLAAWSPDIVLAYGGPAVQYSTVAVRSLPHRPRLVVASIGDPMFWIRSRRHARLRSLVLAGADRVFSVAAATATPLIDSLGVDPAKVRIAPTGVPDRFFSIAREERSEALRIVVVGAVSTEKDPVAAVGVVGRVARSGPVELRIVGDGPLAAEVASAADAAGIGDRVTQVGMVADVTPHLAWADVLLQTSRSEGLPGVVLEAAAAGVPSVVYGVGGCAEAVVDGETGVVVAPGDADAAVAALVALGADRERLAELGERAAKRAFERFRHDVAVDRYHDLLADELDPGVFGQPGGELR